MLVDLTLLAAGLAGLIVGGSWLVKGSVALATRFGVAPVVIGLTVVAFGTSTPELVVNVAAGLKGNSGIGFGNVVGSNIANIGLLLGVAALVAPLSIHRILVMREIPMMILASFAAIALGAGGILGAANAGYTRGDGVMLLLLFAVFIYYTVSEALLRNRQGGSEAIPDEEAVPVEVGGLSGARIALFLFAGLAALIAGGESTVRGATEIARGLGIAETVIALTIVAVGTSLPELATTLTAARSGQGDIAIGNIVGSNIYNLLFIWGVSVTIAPTAVPAGGMKDLLVMTGISLTLFPLAFSKQRLNRWEGAVILAIYAAYVSTLVAGSIGG